jgi:hypothetical protein
VIPREGVESDRERMMVELPRLVIPREGVESDIPLSTSVEDLLGDPERGS